MEKLEKLNIEIQKIYKKHAKKLPFHGIGHINFVKNKALEFSEIINADKFLVESSALTHDLNYIVKRFSKVEDGEKFRNKLLLKCGYSENEIKEIKNIIDNSDIVNRGNNKLVNPSKEIMCLSDADMLFKYIPTTPIFFSGKYLIENKVDIETLADKIINDQKPLFDNNNVFYIQEVKDKYMKWAKNHIELWEYLKEALKDKDIKDLI